MKEGSPELWLLTSMTRDSFRLGEFFREEFDTGARTARSYPKEYTRLLRDAYDALLLSLANSAAA